MNDVLLDPPPAPQPEKKDTLTFNKKNLAIAFLAVSIFILILAIVIPGSNSSSPATNNTPAPVITAAPAPVVNKYDAYLEHMYNNSGQANTITKAELIKYGDLVCNALDSGRTIPWIVNYLSTNAADQSDLELFASLVYGSITYICNEYKADLSAYLAN